MYISKLILKNIRCFDNFEITFDKPGESIVISGDNGEGKSTILRSIAIGLCDESSAAALHRELPGDFVRKGQSHGTIEIELIEKRNRFKIITKIDALKAFEKITQRLKKNNQEIDAKHFPWRKLFVAGYGSGLRTEGVMDYQDYLSVDAVYTLFRYDWKLQNPELVLRRLIGPREQSLATIRSSSRLYFSEAARYSLVKNLKKALNLNDEDDILLTNNGIELKRKGKKVELSAQGDGHIATITWILDLYSWWSLFLKLTDTQRPFASKHISGIVIVDEIEQHLHPKWQIQITETLCAMFPKIQFILSSHSPLVLSGCEHFPVWLLKNGNPNKINAFGWLAEDVYEWMGLPTSRPPAFLLKMEEYKNLDLSKLKGRLNKSEILKMKQLKKEFSTLPSDDTFQLATEIANLQQLLKNTKRS